MKKRLSIILTLLVVLSLAAISSIVAVSASGGASIPTGTALTQSSIGKYFSNKYGVEWYELKNDTYYLSEDVTLTAELRINETVTLDLNGHVLDLNGNSVYIRERADLTLRDSSPNAVHKFDKTNAPWTPAADDAAGESIVEVRGGIIAGGKGNEDGGEILGGGVYVSSYSTFTMNGGSIVGCSADHGGGVYVENSTFTMNGGSIVGCAAASSGGGVYVIGRYGAFSMNGGSIADCTAAKAGGVYATTTTTISGSIVGCSADRGGGVYATSTRPTTLNGSITGCTAASYGGGVYATESLVMEDGSIADCTAAKAGGGVYVEKQYFGNDPGFTMNGGTIMNCTAGGVSNAVHANGPFTSNGGSADPVTGSSLSSYGEAANPFLIDSAEDLKDFRDRVNNGETTLCARLTNDIVLNEGAFDESGTWSNGDSPDRWTPIGWYENDDNNAMYSGTFDGGGYTIKGLYVNGDNSPQMGLFGCIYGAAIKNLTVTGYVKGGERVGGIVGESRGGTYIENCTNVCTVAGSSSYIGGIAGALFSNTDPTGIRNCTNFGSISGSSQVGGIVGTIHGLGENDEIIGCYNKGNVSAKKSDLGSASAGGIAGYIVKSKVTDCHNEGDVSAVNTTERGNADAGGIAANIMDADEIVNCVNTGNVSGSGEQHTYIGGIAGNLSGKINKVNCCYNTGKVSGAGDRTRIGGIVGYLSSESTKVYCCYNTGAVSGTGNKSYVGGIVGFLEINLTNGAEIRYCYWLENTAEKAVGLNNHGGTEADTAVKTKSDFANGDVPALLKQADAAAWQSKCGYLAAAGMTLPLLSWQTADPHDHDGDWIIEAAYHLKECSCGVEYCKGAHFGAGRCDDCGKVLGGGPYTPICIVSADNAENGTVTVSPKTAVRGTIVTVTVTPDNGFVLKNLTVSDKNGNEIKPVDNGDGKYTFIMPSSDVTVKATFANENAMSDVKADDYFYDAVLWAIRNGITFGTDATHFSPSQPCTRAQIVTFLWRAAGSPTVSGAMSMIDVPEDAYYAEAIRWALSEGITVGTTPTTFGPDAECTRAQIVTLLWRAAGSPTVSGAMNMSDVREDAYYAEAVRWALSEGITAGTTPTTFNPDDSCTRAQAVTFLWRASNK